MLCNNCILILIFILMPIAVSIDSNWWSSLKSNNAKDTKTVLVTIVDRVEALEEYKLALETVNCYANLQQYAHKVLILDNSELSTNIALDDDATIVLPSVHKTSHLCGQRGIDEQWTTMASASSDLVCFIHAMSISLIITQLWMKYYEIGF